MIANDNRNKFLEKLVEAKGDLNTIIYQLKKLKKTANKTMKFKKDIDYVNRVIDNIDKAEDKLILLKHYIQKAPPDKLFKS